MEDEKKIEEKRRAWNKRKERSARERGGEDVSGEKKEKRGNRRWKTSFKCFVASSACDEKISYKTKYTKYSHLLFNKVQWKCVQIHNT